jgi:predicted nucleic acid-binding protein
VASIYVDATFYVALLLPRDNLHARALEFIELTRDDQLVTSDPVLVEVLAHLSGLGAAARSSGVEFVRELRDDDQTHIVRQTPDLFDRGLDLYARRLDKGYSLTDAMSMTICADGGITRVLTRDHHFEQEGLTILM